MSRSHYTLSVDAMREACRDQNGPLIQDIPTRSQMACVRNMIADALAMDHAELSKHIADYHSETETQG
jgi:hypothetical protein